MAISIAFFNNKGGVGKTSLVYHLAWMFADLGQRVVAVDLDPQANLTAAFVDEDRLEALWEESEGSTIYRTLSPLIRGIGDIGDPKLEKIADGLFLLPGDLQLSSFEDDLSNQWPEASDGKERAFRVLSAFWRIQQQAAADQQANLILMDLGPNLGAINRAALIGADYIVTPVSPDLFSLQGLKNLGPTVKRWREQWKQRLSKRPAGDLELPEGRMEPAGYVVLQHAVRLDRPVKAYAKWVQRIPAVYRESVLGENGDMAPDFQADPHCLALTKHYRSLMPLAQEARKPIFHLKPADGALGAHLTAAQHAGRDFAALARAIAQRVGLILPPV